MRFEIGKCYRHTSGKQIYICGSVHSFIYGLTTIAETNDGEFIPIGLDESHSVNWSELKAPELSEVLSPVRERHDFATRK